jgi:hypothetical protein
MAINIRGYTEERLNKLIKSNEQLKEYIDKYTYQIKTNTTEWHIDDAKTYKSKLNKALKHDILKYIGKDFEVRLGFGYTSTEGTFIGISDTGLCFFFTAESDEVTPNMRLKCCFYTSVDYFVKNYLA